MGHHPLRRDITQRRPGQPRLGQVRAVEPGALQGGAGEHRRPQVGAAQVGAVEPGVGQVRPPQVGIAQVLAGQVLAREVGTGQVRPRPQPDTQPPRDQLRVRLRHRGRRRIGDGVLRPAGRRVPAGQVGEEVGHQLRHLLRREQIAGMATAAGRRREHTGDLGRDQVLHHRLVDEGEPAVGVAAQRGAGTEQVGGLVRGAAAWVAHRPEHVAGDLGQPGHADEGRAVPPQRDGEFGDGGPPFVDRQLP